MSENQNATPHDLLFEQVWLPAFVEKCAAYRIPIQSEADLTTAVENAIMAKTAVDKMQNDSSRQLHKTANAKLQGLLGRTAAPAPQTATKAAASFLQRTPLSDEVLQALTQLVQ